MNRRRLLGLIGTAPLAGCLTATGGSPADATPPTDGPPSDTTPSSETAPPIPSSTPPVNTGGVDEFDPAATVERVAVGSRAGVSDDFQPHELVVWNAGTDRRTVAVRVRDTVADETVYRGTEAVPADDALELTLLAPSRYVVQLWGPNVQTESLLVPCDLFDCNSSTTRIAVFDDGRVASSVISTLVGCPAPDCA